MSAPRARPLWGRAEAERGSVCGADGRPAPSAPLGTWAGRGGNGGPRAGPSTCRDFGARQLGGVRWHAGEGGV